MPKRPIDCPVASNQAGNHDIGMNVPLWAYVPRYRSDDVWIGGLIGLKRYISTAQNFTLTTNGRGGHNMETRATSHRVVPRASPMSKYK